MDKSTRHVMPGLKGGWAVRAAGAGRAAKTYPTKKEAIEKARDIAKREGGTLYIHKEDGSISEKRSFVDTKEGARAQ